MYYELSKEFEDKVGMHHGSVLSPFLYGVVVDVASEFARTGALSELLYADDFVLMNDAIVGLRNKILKWLKYFDSIGLNITFGKNKVMVISMNLKEK